MRDPQRSEVLYRITVIKSLSLLKVVNMFALSSLGLVINISVDSAFVDLG